MKEASFYTLVNPLGQCSNFDEYLEQIDEISQALFGPGDYGIMTCRLREHRPVLEGGAAELESFVEISEALVDGMPSSADRKSGPSQAEVQEFLNRWASQKENYADKSIRVARLCKGVFFSCFLVGVKKSRGFSSSTADLFASLGLFSEQLIGRLNMINNDVQIRRQLFAFRAECPAAFFHFEPGHGLMPMNHQAVTFSDNHWDQDVPVFMPEDKVVKRMDEVMAISWNNPIEAFWSSMQIDLGDGEREVYVIPRIKGDAILMLQERPKKEAGAKPSDYLTRRQAEIMDWIAEGKASAEVALILGISPRTVEKHLEAIYQRLGVENRLTAMRRYLELKGVIEV